MINIYTDGSCKGNPGPGGWAAIIEEDGTKRSLAGREDATTNNRMEMLATIKGLEAIPDQSEVTVISDSRYVVNTMTRNWKRKANQDLWARLDSVVKRRRVHWEWVRGHSGHPGNEEADALANRQIGPPPKSQRSQPKPRGNDIRGQTTESLHHLDTQGRAQMVDVGGKPDTVREAVARGFVFMSAGTLRLIVEGNIEKGDVLTVARLAGIMGAKQTPHLIPLCHPIPLNRVTVELEPDDERSGIRITATATTEAKTGVEMEALTAVTVAALTIYDMCKSHDRAMRIEAVRLVSKRGGKSGDIILEE